MTYDERVSWRLNKFHQSRFNRANVRIFSTSPFCVRRHIRCSVPTILIIYSRQNISGAIGTINFRLSGLAWLDRYPECQMHHYLVLQRDWEFEDGTFASHKIWCVYSSENNDLLFQGDKNWWVTTTHTWNSQILLHISPVELLCKGQSFFSNAMSAYQWNYCYLSFWYIWRPQ